MAKAIINVGTDANDGTGDPIRTAMSKTNANFTELYNSVGDLETGNYANADVDTHLNIAAAEDDQVLSYDGSDYAWVDQGSYSDSDAIAAVTGADLDMSGRKVLFGNVYNAVGDLPSASSYHGMFAHVHGTGKGYFAHSGSWVELANASDVGGGGSLPSRTSPTGTTSSLADAASADLNITGFKSYALLSITTDKAAWVRLYANGATRTSDASRTENTDPAADAGVIAEVITTGAQTIIMSPGVIGFNLEATPTTVIPCKVTNKSGSTGTVVVTLNLLQLEA